MSAPNTQHLAPLFRLYTHPRLLLILALGFASGLPLALTGATLSAWLVEAGVDLTAIGFFAMLATPYALKFAWSPLMDSLRLPRLHALLGRRKSWLLLTQLALIALIVALGFADPAFYPWFTALFALLVAFASASQDIVIDAYRVEILEPHQQGAGAAMISVGYRLGMLASGGGALAMSQVVSWQVTYLAMAALMGAGVLATLWGPKPEEPPLPPETNAAPGERFARWLQEAVVAPFADFMRRDGWLMILLFVALYKLGDAFLGAMFTPFLLDIGFTKLQIAKVVKLYGMLATIGGTFIGGFLVSRYGTLKPLWVAGIVHMLTNLMMVVQARLGANEEFLIFSIICENVSGGMTLAALVAFISSLCKLRYTATQYALLSSLAALARTTLSGASGAAAETLGWEWFFVLSTALALPGLVLLWWISKRLGTVEAVRRPVFPEPAR